MRKSLVVGASGQVGEYVFRCLRKKDELVFGTYWQHPRPNLLPLDIRNTTATSEFLLQTRPDVIYLPAALTNVDFCESNPDLAYDVNVIGTCSVVRLANQIPAKLVYFSSDYVFDGTHGPYSELDPTRPICEYGRNKLMSEHYIAVHANDYLIVRTTVVYGWESQGKNFVQRLINKLQNAERVLVPVDQVGSPTYAPNLADAVVELAELDAQGLYHVVGPKLASRYDFAVAVAHTFDLDAHLLESIPTSHLVQVAPRPLKAGMTIEKAQAVLKTTLVDYEEGLRQMVNEQLESK